MEETSPMYDVVFRGAQIVDGTGKAPYIGDIAISGDRIAAVTPAGSAGPAKARLEIDASGKAISPGFIDAHTHDDNAVLAAPEMTPKISQGVTSVVVGNCGISLAPTVFAGDPPPPLNLLGQKDRYCFARFADYVDAVNGAEPAVNVAALVGHSSLRITAMADVSQGANRAEIAAMQEALAEGLKAGAIGFSTGLYYKPNMAADMDEVVALVELVGRAGGVYATHMRDEHVHVLDSLEETFETARRADTPVVISHHKCAGKENWGRSRETLPIIAAASEHQPIGLDAYPYAAGSTVLDVDHVDEEIPILVTWSEAVPEASGRYLADLAKEWGCDQFEAAERLDPAGAIYFQMAEEDVRRILAFPGTMIGSDGLPHDAHPHPRLWGTFPRVIGHYGREVGLFSLEVAVHKMTGLPAQRFGLKDRGVLREGAHADLVMFDPQRIIDAATFEMPMQPALGIGMVMVNGQIAWQDGAAGVRAGRFLRRAGC
ncbi:MAG: N-acyl-D-amino-acid deacylase family protein [Alphaproteobacteria bacterium]